jgi:hypothetical protein
MLIGNVLESQIKWMRWEADKMRWQVDGIHEVIYTD